MSRCSCPPPSPNYLHGDIKRLRVTKEDGTAADYEIDGIDFSAKTFNWKPDSPLLDDAVQLDTGDYEDNPPQLPTDGWLIYYKTDVEVKDAAKSYTFSLIDDKGVSSDPETVSTAKVKAKNVKLYSIGNSEITNNTQDNPGAIAAGLNDDNVTLKAKTETAGAKITGKVEKKENGGSWTPVKNVNSSTNEVDIVLTAPEPDKEILYSIAVTAGGNGFVSSAEKTFYVKVTKTKTITIKNTDPNPWKTLKENAEGPNGPGTIIIEGQITATDAAGNFGEITITRDLTIKGKAGADTDTLNANRDGTNAPTEKHRIFKVASGKTLTLENLTLKNGQAESGNGGGAIYAEGALTMKKCKVTGNIAYAGNGGGIYAGGALTMTECEVTSNTVDSNDAGGGGIYIHTASTTTARTMENCTVSHNTAKQGNGGGIYTADKLTITGGSLENNTVGNTSGGNGGGIYVEGSTLTVKNNCSIKDNKAISNGNGGGISVAGNTTHNGLLNLVKCTLTGNNTAHGSGGGIIVVKSHLTMENCTLTGNDGGNNGSGGGVYVGDSGTFTIKDKSCITPSTGPDKDKKGKNDVYLENSKKINIEGVLTYNGIVARITPASYGNTVQVLDGNITGGTPQNYTKFTVTPNGTTGWKVNNQGKLEKEQGGGSSGKTINGADADAWKQLKEAVASAAADSTITIIGEITAKNGTDAENRGQIEIKKNITIEMAAGATSAVLNANRVDLGAKAHRIFTVQDGATLTLKNITLKNGKGTSGIIGGAILVNQVCTVKLNTCTIEDCIADSGGAIGCYANGTVELTDTDIKTCESTSTSGGAGGGAIYTKGNLTINGGNLTGNKTTLNKGSGGGVYVGKDGTLTMNNCTLTGNEASANGGGGVFVGSNAKKFTMKGSSCITPSTGSDANVKGKNDVFLAGGRMITIEDVLNPQTALLHALR